MSKNGHHFQLNVSFTTQIYVYYLIHEEKKLLRVVSVRKIVWVVICVSSLVVILRFLREMNIDNLKFAWEVSKVRSRILSVKIRTWILKNNYLVSCFWVHNVKMAYGCHGFKKCSVTLILVKHQVLFMYLQLRSLDRLFLCSFKDCDMTVFKIFITITYGCSFNYYIDSFN